MRRSGSSTRIVAVLSIGQARGLQSRDLGDVFLSDGITCYREAIEKPISFIYIVMKLFEKIERNRRILGLNSEYGSILWNWA